MNGVLSAIRKSKRNPNLESDYLEIFIPKSLRKEKNMRFLTYR